MKKINLFFKEYHVGMLTFDGKNYCYSSVSANEKAADEEYISFSMKYKLKKSETRVSEKIFAEFSEFLNTARSEDVMEESGARGTDTDFECLWKYAALPQDEFLFHLKRSE